MKLPQTSDQVKRSTDKPPPSPTDDDLSINAVLSRALTDMNEYLAAHSTKESEGDDVVTAHRLFAERIRGAIAELSDQASSGTLDEQGNRRDRERNAIVGRIVDRLIAFPEIVAPDLDSAGSMKQNSSANAIRGWPVLPDDPNNVIQSEASEYDQEIHTSLMHQLGR